MGRKKIKQKVKKFKYDYQCIRCSTAWSVPKNNGACPACGNDYYKWLNYGKFELNHA